MMLPFHKYHGAGNDFILVDNRKRLFIPDQKTIAQWCNRRIGIGADGLILIQDHPDFEFEMIYFNADGNIGSMCGNGGRCAVIFANELGIAGKEARFMAYDGVHTATVLTKESARISMQPVKEISKADHAFILDTGSPHYVQFVPSIKELDVVAEGRKIRNSARFQEDGINVNFVEAGQ
jgi:diaminopimelate epimerase